MITVGDNYLDMVRRFPLRRIRSAAEMKRAGDILDHYVGRDDLTPGKREYVGALVYFVRDYEEQDTRAKLRRVTPVELLKRLMQENRMNTSDLGVILGSRGLASEVLNGKRGPNKTLTAKLARRFRVEPAMFLDYP